MNKEINLPKFDSEDDERAYWADIDLTDYFQPSDFDDVSFPNLKPTTRPVSIRFPEFVIDAVKEKANKMGIPYQVLIKKAVADAFVDAG